MRHREKLKATFLYVSFLHKKVRVCMLIAGCVSSIFSSILQKQKSTHKTLISN